MFTKSELPNEWRWWKPWISCCWLTFLLCSTGPFLPLALLVPIPAPPPLFENNELIEGVLKGCERVLATCVRGGAAPNCAAVAVGGFTDDVDGVEQCRNSVGELGGGWENRFWWCGACCAAICWAVTVLRRLLWWLVLMMEESLLPEWCWKVVVNVVFLDRMLNLNFFTFCLMVS